jgi:hypothetical protein
LLCGTLLVAAVIWLFYLRPRQSAPQLEDPLPIVDPPAVDPRSSS